MCARHDSSLSDDPLHTLANTIRKDVWRTDRNHRFYAGDSNKNSESLFNILMTYSLANSGNHNSPNDSIYVQGMTDLLSPLLYVLKDEALAYICFCALIKRCSFNFDVYSDKITTKLSLLSCLLKKYDNEFWSYLVRVGADQLLFVYRWLLIECKREFPFESALCALEVMWSTITPQCEVENGNSNLMSSSMMMSASSCCFSGSNASKSVSTSNLMVSSECGDALSSSVAVPSQSQACVMLPQQQSAHLMMNTSNYNQYQFGRSVSNASSISLRILRQIDPSYTSGCTMMGPTANGRPLTLFY